jgi:mannitol/fructose-specific phosphotransferase system IIA component (Ntr-type)
LTGASVIADLRAKDALGVIEELAARAYSNGWLADKPWFIGAVVEREALASTAMEGGVAFLHTRARDTGKISRPFIIVGRSYPGIDFAAPDGQLTYLFFLLGLKYDKLHLPILGRLARSLRNPATVSKLRATSSPEVMRDVLLREDALLLSGNGPARPPIAPPSAPPAKPKALDLAVRKRAIMRMQAQRKRKTSESEPATSNPNRTGRHAEAARLERSARRRSSPLQRATLIGWLARRRPRSRCRPARAESRSRSTATRSCSPAPTGAGSESRWPARWSRSATPRTSSASSATLRSTWPSAASI